MIWDHINGQWRHLTVRMRAMVGTTGSEGEGTGMLMGKLQSRYGAFKDDAKKRLDDWMTPERPADPPNPLNPPDGKGE